MEPSRTFLFNSLARHLPETEARHVLKVLDPVFGMVISRTFPFGNPNDVPLEIPDVVAVVTNKTCHDFDTVSYSRLPSRLTTTVPSSSFLTKTKHHLEPKLEKHLADGVYRIITIDVRISFGERLTGVLPTNLFAHFWETVRYWVLCEIAGKPLKKECAALEQLVLSSIQGFLVIGFKPTNPNIALVVCSS